MNCKYYDKKVVKNNEVLTEPKKNSFLSYNTKDSFLCYYTNIQSICNKRAELFNLVDNYHPSLIALTETWTTDEMYDGELAIPMYNVFRNDRMHGGAMIYVEDGLIARPCNLFDNIGFKDSDWCFITLNNKEQLLVGVCYRSPNSDADNNNKLLEILDSIEDMKLEYLLLMGDFNLPQIDFVKHEVDAAEGSFPVNFFDKTQDMFLHQHVSFNTRYRDGNRPSLLDLIFTNEIGMVENLKEDPPIGASDHVGMLWSFRSETFRAEQTFKKYDYWKGDYKALGEFLDTVTWDVDFEDLDTESAWLRFKEKYIEGVQRFIPLRTESILRKKLPKRIRDEIKIRDRLWKEHKKLARLLDYERYRIQRNKVKSMIHEWEQDEERRRIQLFKGNKKFFYGYVRGKQKVKTTITQIKKVDGSLTETEEEAAEALNLFFNRYL